MNDCLFCRIVDGEIPAEIVAENRDAIAFRDINPAAPFHVLVIPRQHVADVHALSAPEHTAALAGVMDLMRTVVAEHPETDAGYRTVFNTGAHGGQTVFHVHMHILAGRPLSWPPG